MIFYGPHKIFPIVVAFEILFWCTSQLFLRLERTKIPGAVAAQKLAAV